MTIAPIVALFIVSGLMSLQPGECEFARRSFLVDYILPENAEAAGVPQGMVIGTDENMTIDPSLNIDLTGLWWMDGNPLPEYLVSWAGADAPAGFPSMMSTPNNLAGRWGWHTDPRVWAIQSYYAFSTEPTTQMWTKWYNDSYAGIIPVTEEMGDVFHFYKLTNDTWDRRPSYILRRVVFGNGTAHPEYWPKFTEFFESQQPDKMMTVWASDNDCHRKCQVALSCRFCSMFC